MPLEDLPLEELVQLCRQANEDYLHNRPHDDSYGFELFRRAFVLAADEALHEIRQLYFPQLLRWVASHAALSLTDETEEYFATEAFNRLYFALRGERFNGFTSLPAIMQYGKMCTYSAIAQYARDRPNLDVPISDIDLPDKHISFTVVEKSELWDHVLDVLQTDKQRRLAYLVFVLDMKPAEIVATYPEEWANERSVSVALYRVRSLLRNNDEIRGWLNPNA